MEPVWGEWLTRWTVRLAVGCVLARMAVDLYASNPKAEPLARRFWTVGCGLYLLHVAAAFHVVHDWSHTAAYRSTAEQTAALTGISWGGGLWLNYLFTVLWCVDVAGWWSSPHQRAALPPWLRRTYAGWFGFIVFNATVVFGPPFWRVVGIPAVTALGVLLIRRARAERYSREE